MLCVKNQRWTKDEPRNTERTPNHPKVLFVKIALATGLVLGDFPPSITCPFFVYCPAESPITLLAFCLFIISNTIEFSSLHRLYPIARRASYRRSRPITSWRFRAIRSLPITLVHLVLPFPFLLAVLLCGVPETLVAFWGALCGSAREKSHL